jgi:hypothetical protein
MKGPNGSGPGTAGAHHQYTSRLREASWRIPTSAATDPQNAMLRVTVRMPPKRKIARALQKVSSAAAATSRACPEASGAIESGRHPPDGVSDIAAVRGRCLRAQERQEAWGQGQQVKGGAENACRQQGIEGAKVRRTGEQRWPQREDRRPHGTRGGDLGRPGVDAAKRQQGPGDQQRHEQRRRPDPAVVNWRRPVRSNSCTDSRSSESSNTYWPRSRPDSARRR